MPLLSIFNINQTLCILFFSHTILGPRCICHILHILESIFGGNIFYLRSNKLLIYIVVIVILIIKLSKIFLDLLSISLRILIVIILFPLFEPLYCEQRLLINVGFKETSFAQPIFENHETNPGLVSVPPIPSVDASISPEHLSIP